MISIHALLAESDVSGNYNQTVNGISIHALLAESDFPTVSSLPRAASFLSTLSLRRATYDLHGLKMGYCISIHALLAESDQAGIADVTQRLISIHALLAESDVGDTPPCCGCMISIHALLAESDCWCWEPGTVTARFLSTLSLRRATLAMAGYTKAEIISIHALLAESDYTAIVCAPPTLNFYPRSPCGERPIMVGAGTMILPFLSTLSLRRATTGFDSGTMVPAISIHALLAESDPTMPCTDLRGPRFLSTLSLRRATAALSGGTLSDVDFYPRSPCGERRSEGTTATSRATFLSTLSLRRATRWPVPAEKGSSISIHALLAESDGPRLSSICPTRLFLSTLSLRRATYRRLQLIKALKFLSTLSLRRATD